MLKRLTREELINLVNKIIECEGSNEEIDEMIELVKRNVPYPDVSDLIYWHDEELTSEQIVDKALNYKPIQLESAAETDSFYSEANIKRLKKSIVQLDIGNGNEHDLIESD